MVEGKKVDDLLIRLEMSDEAEYKYVDIEISYQFETQEEVSSIINAINKFVEANKKGLGRTSINILGYSYKY